jgi:hypothetical protein
MITHPTDASLTMNRPTTKAYAATYLSTVTLSSFCLCLYNISAGVLGASTTCCGSPHWLGWFLDKSISESSASTVVGWDLWVFWISLTYWRTEKGGLLELHDITCNVSFRARAFGLRLQYAELPFL